MDNLRAGIGSLRSWVASLGTGKKIRRDSAIDGDHLLRLPESQKPFDKSSFDIPPKSLKSRVKKEVSNKMEKLSGNIKNLFKFSWPFSSNSLKERKPLLSNSLIDTAEKAKTSNKMIDIVKFSKKNPKLWNQMKSAAENQHAGEMYSFIDAIGKNGVTGASLLAEYIDKKENGEDYLNFSGSTKNAIKEILNKNSGVLKNEDKETLGSIIMNSEWESLKTPLYNM